MTNITVNSNDFYKYNPNSQYWIAYDENCMNKVSFFMGSMLPIYNLSSDYFKGLKAWCLGQIDETTFNVFNASCSQTALMSFFDPEIEEVFYKKFYVELGHNTFYDVNEEIVYSLDNIIRFRTYCYNDEEAIDDEIQEIEIKNMKLKDKITGEDKGILNDAILNNSNSSTTRKVTIKNGDMSTLNLVSDGAFNIRLKAKIPGIEHTWLSMYFTCKKLSDDEIKNYKNNSNENTLRYITPFVNPYVNQ